MAYQVFARKYRPTKFSELVGQEHVARSLKHTIERDRVAHAYLFSGPRGVGKTSVARIFAQALNCENHENFEPCGICRNCQSIAQGSSLAVWEIDGASHNSVDNIRELTETFRTAVPAQIRKRVYIIDEVHMLSVAAFNAFLKSLEEPPKDLVIVMATTEAHKIPDTVVSRCQKYDFRLLPTNMVSQRLAEILERESVQYDAGTLTLVSRLSEGSLRDALSLLDRIVSFCGVEVSLAEASKVLGVVNKSELFRLSEKILKQDVEGALSILHSLGTTGGDTSLILREFVTHWRELLLACFLDVQALELHGIGAEDGQQLRSQTELVDKIDIKQLNEIARDECDRALRSYHPWYAFEALIVRMATRETSADLRGFFESLKTGGGQQAPAGGSIPVLRKSSSAEKSARRVAPAPNAETESASAEAGTLDWREFVEFVKRQSGGRLLAEQLRRVGVEQFSAGVLRLSGDKLAKNYLQRADNKEKIASALQSFTKLANWDIQLVNGAKQPTKYVSKSLKHAEEKNKQDHSRKIRSVIEQSEVMRNIKEVFPGSELKRIANGD